MTVVAAEPNNWVPIEPDHGDGRTLARAPAQLRRDAIVAAALLHAVVIAALLVQWPFVFTPPVPEKEPITVALVTEPAPEPPQAKPTPAPEQQRFLTSGKDQQTTAPPTADAEGPAAAPKPQPQPLQAETQTLAPAKPAAPTPPVAPRLKEATRETAPQKKQGSVNRAPGETEQEGDPYLNHMWAMIEQHRSYPAGTVGSLGLNLEGTVVYLIEVSPAGALQAIRLERSSGTSVLDDTARRMIQQAAPFPPLPAYYPQQGVVLTVTIHLFPTAS